MMLWLVCAALTLIVLALLLVPLLVARPFSRPRSEYDLAVYRDQLGEVEREVERGTLAAAQAESARVEIQRRILALEDKTAAQPTTRRRPWPLAVTIAVLVPCSAFALYALLGSPGLPDRPYALRAAQIREMQDQGEMIRGMVAQLSARLEQSPDDGKGWAMLGRSLRVLGQREQSIAAYRKAASLLPDDAAPRMELAGLLLQDIAQGSPLPEEFVRLMREILALEPENMDALYFSGIAALQAGDSIQARTLWTKVMTQLPEGEDKAEIKKQIEALP